MIDKFNNLKVSIVIPVFNDFEYFEKLITSIVNQSYLPYEIIVIDSSHYDKIDNYIESTNFPFKLIYKRFYSKNYFSRLKPGKARNIGYNYSTGDYLIFLDTKTIPQNNWLELNINYLIEKKAELILGLTKFTYNNYFTKITLYSTFGNELIETLPGTIISRNIFEKNKFIEEVRSGEDLEWKERMQQNYKNYIVNKIPLKYSSLPKNIYLLMKKYFIYSINGAFINVQKNQKDLYLSILLIISLFIIPRWNYYLNNWEESFLYIPNITKYYLISIIFLFTLFIVFKNLFIDRLNLILLSLTIKLLFFIGILYSVFRWNDLIANWAQNNILYIPHVTKLFIFLVLFSSLIYRGIISPFKKKIKINELIPFQWFFIGFIGLLIDLIKAPGLILGSILSIMNFNFKKKK